MAGSSSSQSVCGCSPSSSQSPSQFFSSAIEGLANGALYALIALGYTLVYGIIELINFAHGDLFMLGTIFSAFWVTTVMHQTGVGATGWAALIATLVIVMAHVRGHQRHHRVPGLPHDSGARPSWRR